MKKVALPLRFGIAISGSLIAYFLILSLFKLHINPIFSLFNGVIVVFGIYEAIRSYKLEKGNILSFSGGTSVCIVSVFVATIIFAIFFTFYANEINTDFLPQLLGAYSGSYDVGIGLVSFTVAIMGFATTVVLTLTFMQLLKIGQNRNN